MRKITLALIFFCSMPAVFARQSEDDDPLFLKRIENNYINNVVVELPNGKEGGMYNMNSKIGIEKRFFGDFNAKVEYFLDPSFLPNVGFRIYRDSLDITYLLEIKSKDRKSDSITSNIVPVSDIFADSVYAKTVQAIKTFTVTGKPLVPFDGYWATFRCVVGAEVWTFTVKTPFGDVRKLSDLFRRMIADVEAGTFDEAKYLEAPN